MPHAEDCNPLHAVPCVPLTLTRGWYFWNPGAAHFQALRTLNLLDNNRRYDITHACENCASTGYLERTNVMRGGPRMGGDPGNERRYSRT